MLLVRQQTLAGYSRLGPSDFRDSAAHLAVVESLSRVGPVIRNATDLGCGAPVTSDFIPDFVAPGPRIGTDQVQICDGSRKTGCTNCRASCITPVYV
jgi:hypothetical protein